MITSLTENNKVYANLTTIVTMSTAPIEHGISLYHHH